MSFKINPKLDLSDLKAAFQDQRSVQVYDFLVAEDAGKLFQFFTESMPDHWWFTSTLIKSNGNQDYNEGVTHTRRSAENLKICNDLTSKANQSFHKGQFCYSFDRTLNNHFKDCNCQECRLKKFISSETLLNFINEITGMDVSVTKELFSSRYRAGQFLSPHHDHNKGKIGFVFSLSKGWRPQDGGLLHFMEDDYSTITKVVQPVFNRLVMFDIISRNGVPHFVSHVAPDCKKHRISVTGWFA